MNKIVYTRPDGGVSIVIPASKKDLEKSLGKKLSTKQYKAHVMKRSIPADATKVREIEDKHLPLDRSFRNAWTDEFPTETIDIDARKAKDIQLAVLRAERDKKLKELDTEMLIALETNNSGKELRVKALKDKLRKATDPLKQLKVKSDDQKAIKRIKELGNPEQL